MRAKSAPMAESIATTVQRVSHMNLIISDQDKALAFYTAAVGAEVRGDQVFEFEGNSMRWLTIGIPGDDLEIVLMPPVPGPDGNVPTVGDNNMTVFSVSDCAVATEAWRAAGGKVESEPEALPWGLSSVVRDPDGNPFNLVQPAEN